MAQHRVNQTPERSWSISYISPRLNPIRRQTPAAIKTVIPSQISATDTRVFWPCFTVFGFFFPLLALARASEASFFLSSFSSVSCFSFSSLSALPSQTLQNCLKPYGRPISQPGSLQYCMWTLQYFLFPGVLDWRQFPSLALIQWWFVVPCCLAILLIARLDFKESEGSLCEFR